jgi:ABC-type multidrug transport system ATPase subunit
LSSGNLDVTKTSVIAVNNLRKYYGDPSALRLPSGQAGSGRGVKAVDGISFEVWEGDFFGFLGPNGAGKTTTIEMIEGYKTPDSGSVTALGLDPRKDGYELRERIGITLQETSVYPPHLRADELLQLSTPIS